MKRIIAFVMAMIISIFIMINNCYRAFAAAVPVTILAPLIEACVELIVGSGTVSQSQINQMSTTDIFDTTKSSLPNIDLNADAKLKADFMKKFNEFICTNTANQFINLADFIIDHVYDLPTNKPILNGYGAVIVHTSSISNYPDSSSYRAYTYCDYLTVETVRFTNGRVAYRYRAVGDNCYSIMTDGKTTSTYMYSFTDYFDSTTDDLSIYGDLRALDDTDTSTIVTPAAEVPEKIGTVDVDGTTYDVTGDGTVTIGDDTYTINDDGSITIDGVPYYPDYDLNPYPDTAIDDLLTDILDNIQVIEEDGTEDLVDEAEVDVPIDIANSELSSLTLPKSIATVFPFCIPWDFYNGIKLFSQTPKAPRFEVPFEIPQFGLFPGFKKIIVLDFSDYDSAFSVVRWVTFSLFMFGLCFITFKIVKGA